MLIPQGHKYMAARWYLQHFKSSAEKVLGSDRTLQKQNVSFQNEVKTLLLQNGLMNINTSCYILPFSTISSHV